MTLLEFPFAAFRRFKEIDGKNLALVIAANLFISIVPLLILGYALVEAFNPNRSFGVVLVQRFDLRGATAQQVRNTFTNAKSGESEALSISAISVLVTGFGIAATFQEVYARAFRMQPLRGLKKFMRGWLWLVVLLATYSLGLTLRYWASSRPVWFIVMIVPLLVALQFAFYLATPRLLIDLPFGWRDLVPGAVVCTAASVVLNEISAFLLRNWFSAYGHAYGGFGVALALISYIGITASFWVWIATVSAIYWERKAGTVKVAAMESRSRQ